MDPHKFHGKDIPHIKLDPKMTIEDLVDVFASSGYNGRQLGDAAKLYAKMIEEDATICLTISFSYNFISSTLKLPCLIGSPHAK